MTTMVSELYAALRKAGVDEATAQAAAEMVVGRHEGLATKQDVELLGMALRRDMAELKAELLKWVVGLLVAQVGLFTAIVGLIKVFG